MVLVIFIIVLVLFIICIIIYNTFINKKYYCTDYDINKTFEFKIENKKFIGVEEDKLMEFYSIYDDLINSNDSSFTFNNKLSIIVAITVSYNTQIAKKRSIE